MSRADEPAGVTAGTVLELMFSRGVKTRGLFQQRSLEKMLDEAKDDLQVAFVVDGTDSMERDIEGILDSLKYFVGQLREAKGTDNVAFSLVVYRDENADSGPTTMPLQDDFTKSYSDLEKAITDIQTETGAPYFPEAVDAGIHEALTDLDWKDKERSSRWLILFADAPPYNEGFTDEQSGARRRFTTEQLVHQAKELEVRISSILCSSGYSESDSEEAKLLREVYDKSKPRLREFMDSLAQATDGVVWDLSDGGIREKLAEAAREKRLNEQDILPITPKDVVAAKRSDIGTLRLAVLPHLPIREMRFDPSDDAVNAATEMRLRLGNIPGIEIANPTEVSDAFLDLRQLAANRTQATQFVSYPTTALPSDAGAGRLTDEDMLSRLAVTLDTDYVVWGNKATVDDVLTWKTGLFKKADGSQLLSVTEDIRPDNERARANIGLVIAEKLAKQAAIALRSRDAGHAARFAKVAEPGNVRDAFKAPITKSPRARRRILQGLESLEQAVGYPRESAAAEPLLVQAESSLGVAERIDSENPFVHMLLASCYYNLAYVHGGPGSEKADTYIDRYREAIESAYEHRDKATCGSITTEIEADYALLIERDHKKAFRLYNSLLAASNDGPPRAHLRAHWMLAGMYCGDWGVDPEMVDAAKGRSHLISILADFEHSPVAEFVRSSTLWDSEDGTINPMYRRDNVQLAANAR